MRRSRGGGNSSGGNSSGVSSGGGGSSRGNRSGGGSSGGGDPVVSVAEDFDLACCGVCVVGVEGGDEWVFGGDANAVRAASCGRRELALTKFAFEPLLPGRGYPHWPHWRPPATEAEASQRHALALEFTVDRQMRRIAKYAQRGFAWA